jgi:CBS domain-containing protein
MRTGEVADVDAVTRPMREWIAAIDRTDTLGRYAADAAAVAAVLMAGNAGPVATCRALTSLHDALTIRLIELSQPALGPPPCSYAWLALGSGGRMEQSLCTDQDHAVVYAGDVAAAEYFAALGTRVVAGLASAGIRRCPGGYMADRWHMPLARWCEVFHGWVQSPEPPALVEAEVFLDFRRVHGELSPAPLDAVLLSGSGTPRFLVGSAWPTVGSPAP